MIRDCFDLVCLFGFSPHFRQIADFLDAAGIDCIFIFGPRQKDSVDSLNLPASFKKLCVEDLANSAFDEIRVRERKSLGISFGSPFIFSQQDIDNFNGHLINSHGAPLPEFKGGGGFSWRILQRDKRGSILMHFVTTKIDEGACVFRKDFTFSDDERMPCDMENRQIKEESKYLIPWIEQVVFGQAELSQLKSFLVPKDKLGSYFPRLSSDLHGGIDWSLSIHDLESFVLAFSRPYSGAFTFIKDHKVRILDFNIERKCYTHPFTYGLILGVGPEGLLVSCNGGVISIKNENLCVDVCGFSIKPGDRFYTPELILQKALQSRVFYSPDGLVARHYTSNQHP